MKEEKMGEKINVFCILFDLFGLFTKNSYSIIFFSLQEVFLLDATLIFLFYISLIIQEMGKYSHLMYQDTKCYKDLKRLAELLDLEIEKIENLDVLDNFLSQN